MRTELASFVEQVFAAEQEGKTDVKHTSIFVGPLDVSVPDDGIMRYVTIDKLLDLHSVSAYDVVLFREDQARLLRALVEYADEFGFDANILFGVPGVQYDPWFDDAAFGLERVSYSTLVSELRATRELNEQLRAASASGTDKEASAYTTSSGTVRYNSDIEVAGVSGEAADDSELE